jgi:hypothetical protein
MLKCTLTKLQKYTSHTLEKEETSTIPILLEKKLEKNYFWRILPSRKKSYLLSRRRMYLSITEHQSDVLNKASMTRPSHNESNNSILYGNIVISLSKSLFLPSKEINI